MTQIAGMDIRFTLRADETWESMYHDCMQATSSIEVEQYILLNDDIGQKFMSLFIRKAQQGIAIRLILDRVGSRQILSSPSIHELRQAGGEVLVYNPIHLPDLFRPRIWFPRNHSKIMLIDQTICYLGSACIATYMHNWRDTQIRIQGPFAQIVRRDFLSLWQRMTHEKNATSPYQPIKIPTDFPFQYKTSRPKLGTNPIYKELISRIRDARHSIALVTPYFLPPRRLLKAMRTALKNGTIIHLVMSRKTDVLLADCVAHSYIPKLQRMGVQIHLYDHTVLHTKYVIVDDWAMLGSTNLDYLSLIANREANIMISDTNTVQTLKKHFIDDLAASFPAPVDYWQNTLFIYKVIGYIGRYMRKFM